MENHFELSDAEFEQQFAACTLPSAVFSHEAHLRLTWIHIRKYGLEQALENIQQQLQQYVIHLGVTEKYHKTLTIAAVKAVHHFISKSEANNFRDFIQACPQLMTNFKELINSHYSFDIFDSDQARMEYIAPDTKPF